MRFAFLLFMCVVALTACKQNTAKNPATTAVVKGGNLRLPIEAPLSTEVTERFFGTRAANFYSIDKAFHAGLTTTHGLQQVSQGLATSWTSTDEGRTWEFVLGTEAEPVADQSRTAASFVALHWQALLMSDDNPIKHQLQDLIVGARDYSFGKSEKVSGLEFDSHKLKVHLTRPYTLFPSWVSQVNLAQGVSFKPTASAYDAGVFSYGELSASEGRQTLSGTANSGALLGEPTLSGITYYFEPDRRKQFEMYKAGELDTCNVAPEALAEVLADPELKKQLHTYDTAATLVGFIDHHAHPWGNAPFKDKTPLRMAANYALHRAEIAENAGEQFEPWPHFLPKALEDFIDPAQVTSPMFRIEPEVDKAQEGLHLAGHGQASLLPQNMLISYVEDPLLASVASSIKDNFDEVSIRMRPYPCQTEEDALQLVKIGSMDIWLQWVYPAYPSPDALFYPTLHSSLSGLGGNYGRVEDPAIDKLIEQAQAEPDEAARRKLYQQLETEVEQRALFLMLGSGKANILINPKLAGYELTPYDFDASLPAQDFSKLGFTE
jgi:ABC-type transport system substrate-binding protein